MAEHGPLTIRFRIFHQAQSLKILIKLNLDKAFN